jgi:hypothetical protein
MQAQVGLLRQRSGIGTQTFCDPAKLSVVAQVWSGAMHTVQSRTLAHCAAGTQGPQQVPMIDGT